MHRIHRTLPLVSLALSLLACDPPSTSMPMDAGPLPPGTDAALPPGTDAAVPPGTDAALPPGTDGGPARPDAAVDVDAAVIVEPMGCEGGGCSYCDPATWGGSVPTASTDVVIAAGHTVVLDCDAQARTVTIEAGGLLFASRMASSTLTVHGNVIVRGGLDLGTPGSRIPAAHRTELVFAGIDDDDYVGTPTREVEGPDPYFSVLTPMEVLESDVGLWVMGDGVLSAAGTEMRSWGRLLDGAGPGDATFTVEDASGWRVGDRVVLTPTATLAEEDAWAFEESTIASIAGNVVTLASAPRQPHAGCTDCMRRGEAANLSRNVVIRSADDSGHAHVMVAERGVVNLDSAELRWLGPGRCGGVERRAPLYFHQQGDAATTSFVRHVSIWGGEQGFLLVERSNGIEVNDVVGYDGADNGFRLLYDMWPCYGRCEDRNLAAPRDVIFDHVLAARVAVPRRAEDCARINHLYYGIDASGSEGSGVRDSVATGVGWDGSGDTIAGFGWAEVGSGRPADFVFTNNVAHDNPRNGAHVWHNADESSLQVPYVHFEAWSNGGYGVHWGAYQNPYTFQDLVAVDNGLESIGLKSVPLGDELRVDGATIDDMTVLAYVFVQFSPATLRNVTWTGDRPVGVTQIDGTCDGGDENDPNDETCLRAWLRFESPRFPAGVVPFRFGHPVNRQSVWEVRDFSSPDYPSLPADFDLYRADNRVAGGSYHAGFDAWLVPR